MWNGGKERGIEMGGMGVCIGQSSLGRLPPVQEEKPHNVIVNAHCVRGNTNGMRENTNGVCTDGKHFLAHTQRHI